MPSHLEFNVCSHIVRVEIVPRIKGEKLGIAIYPDLILISAKAPHASRFDLLVHELRHAWGWWVPSTQDEEDEAQLTAAIARGVFDDLSRQGGEQALMDLQIAEEPAPQLRVVPDDEETVKQRIAPLIAGKITPQVRASGVIITCTACQLGLPGAAVVNGDVVFDTVRQGTVMRRRIYCPRCEAVQVWIEGCDGVGRPNGCCIEGPAHERGEAVDRFREANAEAVAALADVE